MSLGYCYDCLEPFHLCECGNPSEKEVFGEIRVAYLRGYRDAKENKDEDIVI